MSPQLQQIEERALQLSPEDREILAETLLHSLEEEAPTDIDQAWVEEAERRYQDWKAVKDRGIPSEQFFQDIRRELGWR